MAEFDVAGIGEAAAYRLMAQLVVPRPIALVTTIDAEGRANAAPFSFFNAISFDPCLVVLGVETRPDGSFKDTARNIRERHEFVVNVVDEAMAGRMNLCSVDHPPGVDELAEVGFTAAPSARVRPPRIAEAPAWLECRRHTTLEVGRGRHIVIGELLHLAVRDAVLEATPEGGPPDPATVRVDITALRAIGRMGLARYTRTQDGFDLLRPDRPVV